MRAAVISMLIVALLSAGVCIFSVLLIGRVASEMDEMRTEVMNLADAGRADDAHTCLQQAADLWKRRERLLAILVPHDTLHEITYLLIESGAHLRAGDSDDFGRAMALLGEAISHLHAEELPHLANILTIC